MDLLETEEKGSAGLNERLIFGGQDGGGGGRMGGKLRRAPKLLLRAAWWMVMFTERETAGRGAGRGAGQLGPGFELWVVYSL